MKQWKNWLQIVLVVIVVIVFVNAGAITESLSSGICVVGSTTDLGTVNYGKRIVHKIQVWEKWGQARISPNQRPTSSSSGVS